MKKAFIIFSLLTVTLITSGYRKPDVYKIDAAKNAAMQLMLKSLNLLLIMLPAMKVQKKLKK